MHAKLAVLLLPQLHADRRCNVGLAPVLPVSHTQSWGGGEVSLAALDFCQCHVGWAEKSWEGHAQAKGLLLPPVSSLIWAKKTLGQRGWGAERGPHNPRVSMDL